MSLGYEARVRREWVCGVSGCARFLARVGKGVPVAYAQWQRATLVGLVGVVMVVVACRRRGRR